MSVDDKLLYNTIMKNRIIYILAIVIVMFNGFVWTKIFNNYKEFHKNSVRELTLENKRLKNLVDEFKLEGMEVTVTMYHPVRSQTDSTPDILADGTRIRVHKASEYRFIAVSRNLLKQHGGFLEYGDFIVLSGTDHKDGVYQVKDTMNKRFVNRVDILETPGTAPYKVDSAKIMKTNLVLNN